MGLATTAVLAVAAPAAAVVWPDDEPVNATPTTTEETTSASPRVAPSVGAETWTALENEPSPDEEVLMAPVAVRARPSEKAHLLHLGRSEQVVATGETRGRWAEVVVDDEPRWVRRSELADASTERGTGHEPRRSPQVTGRKPAARGAGSKTQPDPATSSVPETAPTRAASAPAAEPEPAPQPVPAASEAVPPAEAVSEPTPTPAPPAAADEPPAWEQAPEVDPAEDPARGPVVEPGPALPPELEPVPDLAAVLE